MLWKTLLVPVDFTPRSRAALRYALELARASEARVELLHVVPAPPRLQLALDAYLGSRLHGVPADVMERAIADMNALVSSVAAERELGRRIEAGDPAVTIVEIATELDADLIVIGSRVHTGLVEMALGSVAHQVMTCAPCPVLTMRGDELRNRENPSPNSW
jgi:nucleotide-binding universal stress UspA family protein